MDDQDEFEDEFEKEITTRMTRVGKSLAAAEDLAKRLITEGRTKDSIIILEVITTLQQDTVHLAHMHRRSLQRIGERDAQLYRLIDQMFNNLKGLAHLPEETYNSLTGTLQVFAQKTAKIVAANTTKARRPRGSRFPDWMLNIASAEAQKGKKASPKRAADAIADRAAHEDFGGEPPDESTVGRWIKREQAKSKRERH